MCSQIRLLRGLSLNRALAWEKLIEHTQMARALRAPEQVGEGIGVADVAENHPAALIRNPYLSSEPNKISLVIKGESPILAEAWWPISAGYQYGSGASSGGAAAFREPRRPARASRSALPACTL